MGEHKQEVERGEKGGEEEEENQWAGTPLEDPLKCLGCNATCRTGECFVEKYWCVIVPRTDHRLTTVAMITSGGDMTPNSNRSTCGTMTISMSEVYGEGNYWLWSTARMNNLFCTLRLFSMNTALEGLSMVWTLLFAVCYTLWALHCDELLVVWTLRLRGCPWYDHWICCIFLVWTLHSRSCSYELCTWVVNGVRTLHLRGN